jgi:hypothetical protein
MVIQLFKNYNPSSFIIIPFISLIFWINGLLIDQNINNDFHFPLFHLIIGPIINLEILTTIIAYLLITIQAFILNHIVVKNEILPSPSFLTALFYIMLLSSDISLVNINPIIISNLFIIIGLYKLLESYRKDYAFANIFDASILFSIASLFYTPNIVLTLTIFIGILLLRPVIWREWLIALIGLFLPFIFFLTYLFLNDNLKEFWINNMSYNVKETAVQNSIWFKTMLSVTILILTLSLGKLATSLSGTNKKKTKTISLLIWFSCFSTLSFLLIPALTYKHYTTLAIPFSVFLTHYFFYIKKRWLAETLYSIMFLSIIFNLYSNYF